MREGEFIFVKRFADNDASLRLALFYMTRENTHISDFATFAQESGAVEFIDIVEFLDDSQNTLSHRFERHQNEIKNGAKLTVREGQIAVFVSEGQIADVFDPGMYELTTQNVPILATLKGWKHGFNSPFKAEVYFINTTVFDNLKWGTAQPIPMRDKDFGVVQMRAHGGYHIRVSDPETFIKEAVGTDGHFTIDEIEKRLRDYVQTAFPDAIGESKIPLLDMISNYNELSTLVGELLQAKFTKNGLELVDFTISAITVPEAVQKAIDDRSSMGILGDLNAYQQFKTGQAMEEAAKNPNGGAGAGIGMGMGFGMAAQMSQQQAQNQNQQQQQQQAPQQQSGGAPPPPPVPQAVMFHVVVNGAQSGPFDLPTIQSMITSGQITKETMVWKNGMASWAAASSASELTSFFGSIPPPLPPQ